MTDSDQCSAMLSEAARVAIERNATAVQISLLTDRGYRMWSWYGQPSPEMERLAAMPVATGAQ